MAHPAKIALLVCLGTLWTACGDDGGSTDAGDAGDAGITPDGAAPDASGEALPSGAVLAPPALPAMPVPTTLEPCAPGWRAEASPREYGATVCEPWPAAGPSTCGADEAQFPGETGCSSLGPACPAGTWPAGLPTGPSTLYVRTDASPGGDGSEGSPYLTIGDAIAVAADGATIAIAAGDYDEAVAVPTGVTLFGACAAGTRLVHGVRDTAPATLTITGERVVVRNLSIGGARSGLLVDAGASATIESVIVDGATETGLRVHRGGAATIDGLIVRGTQTDPGDGSSAFGLVVEFAGTAAVSRALIEGNGFVGVIVDSPGSVLNLSNSVIRDTLPVEGTGRYGVGIGVQNEGRGELSRVVVENNRYGGATVSDTGSALTLTDSVVRGTVGEEATGESIGVTAVQGGFLRLVRTLVEKNEMASMMLRNGAATVEFEDVVVRDTLADARGAWPGRTALLVLAPGATFRAARVTIEGNSHAGLLVSETGTTATLEDVRILDTEDGLGTLGGVGLAIQGGAAVTANRLLSARNTEAGILVTNGARLEGTDIHTLFTESQGVTGISGRGVQMQFDSQATLERFLSVGNRGAGIAAVSGSTVVASDVTIREMREQIGGVHEGWGMGILVTDQSTATFTRCDIEASLGFGLMASGASTFTATDLRVSGTEGFPTVSFFGSTFGRGMDIQDGAHAEVTRSVIEGNREAGITVWGEDTQLTLRDAIVRDTRSDEATRDTGRGLGARGGAQVLLEQVGFEGNRDITLGAWGEGTVVQATDLEIHDTLENECAVDTCAMTPGGIGIGAFEGAQLTADRFAVAGAALSGVQVGATGEMDLHRGDVSGSLIGANVQYEGYDVGRLTDAVTYRDNGVNLDSASLPVPEPGAAVEAPNE